MKKEKSEAKYECYIWDFDGGNISVLLDNKTGEVYFNAAEFYKSLGYDLTESRKIGALVKKMS
jgi:hypothetical protein